MPVLFLLIYLAIGLIVSYLGVRMRGIYDDAEAGLAVILWPIVVMVWSIVTLGKAIRRL